MTLSYHEAVARAKREIREITSAELAALSGAVLVVDVREPYEFRSGTIPGAVAAPLGGLAAAMDSIAPDPETDVVLICSVGNRSAIAAKELQDRGYRRVASLAGGVAAWRASGGTLLAPGGEDSARHIRQRTLPQIGEEGQRRLGAARVIVVGAGGLGSPVLLYLAGAGVGTLAVIDPDIVELSNLHRQIVHHSDDIGRAKVESAAEAIAAIDPAVRVLVGQTRLTANNARELLQGFDLVVDGSDNFDARYAINDAAVDLGIPMVHGAVYRWEGQVTVLDPRSGPCYRCLFPEEPGPGAAPDCEVAGVFGAVPGVIGSMMAVEAAKVLLGAGDPLVGRLLLYDGLSGESTLFAVARSPLCPLRHGPE